MKRLLVAVLLVPTLLSAQQLPDTPYQKGQGLFPSLGVYRPMEVAPPNLTNSGRIDQLLREGKLTLSLSDAIALALENNLDISIQRYNPVIADLDILRTKAGASARGVRTSVTSSSGGGGGGAGAQGGTGTAAGGVGQGSGGLVTSALGGGASIPSFDPVVTSTMALQKRAFPVTNVIIQQLLGENATKNNTGVANFAFAQGFPTGTNLTFGWNNSRTTTTGVQTSLNPQISSNFQVQLTQRLLQGFGFGPNTRNIRIARNNREVSDLVFKQQVVLTTTQVQNVYWDLVAAMEDVKVRERFVTVADKLYNDNKRQVEIGTLAPIEIVRAEAEVARTRQDLIVAETVLQQLETTLKNMVLRNLNDPIILGARVVPTDRITVPPVEPVVPIQELTATALQARPELAQSRIDMRNRDISMKALKNAMLPSVDAFAYWGGQGVAGVTNPRGTGGVRPPAEFLGGLGTALTQSFFSDFPDYSFGLQLNIPLRNRAAQADAAQAQVEDRQAQLRMRQLENTVRVEVQNAMIALQQNRARLEASQKQRELAERTLDAEQKKFQLGASTIYLVIQSQRDLAAAQSTEVRTLGDYMKSRVELDRATGQTINKNGIVLEEAFKGQVTKQPQVLPVSRQE